MRSASEATHEHTPGRAARGPPNPGALRRSCAPQGRISGMRTARPGRHPLNCITIDVMSSEDGTPRDRIEAALNELRGEATAALESLTHWRQHADELRGQAAAAERSYEAEYRAIRARGFFTAAQLRALGLNAPRTRTQRRKPKQVTPAEHTTPTEQP